MDCLFSFVQEYLIGKCDVDETPSGNTYRKNYGITGKII